MSRLVGFILTTLVIYSMNLACGILISLTTNAVPPGLRLGTSSPIVIGERYDASMGTSLQADGGEPPQKTVILAKRRAFLGIFGVAQRSRGCADETHRKHILRVLERQGYQVHVYVIELVPGVDEMVDGVRWTHSNCSTEHDVCETITSPEIEKVVREVCAKVVCKYRSDYSEVTIQNAVKSLYLEYKVALYLRNHLDTFDIAFSISSDIWLPRDVDEDDIKRVVNMSDANLFTTQNNDAQGYTNGFYMGKPRPLQTIMSRFEDLGKTLPTKKDFEHQLKVAFDQHQIARQVLKGYERFKQSFAKLRYNGDHWGFENPQLPVDVLSCIKKPLPVPVVSQVSKGSTGKPLLIFITPLSRVNNVPVLMARILPVRECFNVKWLLVFSAESSGHWSEHKYFENDSFPWIVQLKTPLKGHPSISGHVERNIALDFMQRTPGLRDGDGFMYFLDDDNLPPIGLCTAPMDTDAIYFGDQFTYNAVSKSMKVRKNSVIPSEDMFRFKTGTEVEHRLVKHVDTGTFLLPLSKWRSLEALAIRWKPIYIHDGIFFSDVIVQLLGPTLQFYRINDKAHFFYNGMESMWSSWYDREKSAKSLKAFRGVVAQMSDFQHTHPKDFMMKRVEVSFHEHVHILYNIRDCLGAKALYLEIGVWKGTTSFFMAQHPLQTYVIGIDPFQLKHQEHDSNMFKQMMDYTNNVTWIMERSTSPNAMYSLIPLLGSDKVDILFIDGDHSRAAVLSDFYKYGPLVAKGGFIIFDDFLDFRYSPDVSLVVLSLVSGIFYAHPDCFLVYGTLPNYSGAGILFHPEQNYYAWGEQSSNEFVVQVLSADSDKCFQM